MLPFGGYRSYRPNILRYDTFIPVTLGIFLVLLMITNADRINNTDYLCERQSLEQIAESKDSIVALDADCTIMNWRKSSNPAYRDLEADLLLFWNVTKTKKLFYQKE